MCGFVGIVDSSEKINIKRKDALKSLEHRGPDAQGWSDGASYLFQDIIV